ncbi:histamine H1 receptor-like [Stylophora pistillata]|uniref:histamine H1 receptor-like n=1 Tax=Stylophora pistillata TaxID=50429 RepID=UPI000C04B391|nr:histamine H1 receptor-like [Stylophora pistillata]
MTSLELKERSLALVIFESTACLTMNIISAIGNTLVCFAVYRNPRLRSTINLYIIALATSDLLCATVEMSMASATLITGRWLFSDTLCWLQGFVDVFITYVTPATMGLTAYNRYMRIVKTHSYNKIFSPCKSKIWLSSLWISIALYIILGRVTNLHSFEFIPGFAVCSVVFMSEEGRLTHYCVLFALSLVFPLSVAFYSYYKIFMKTLQHKSEVAPSLETNVDRFGKVSVQEIKVCRALAFIIAGFLLCWVPMWAFLFWMRFSRETAPRSIQLAAIQLLFLSSTINPFIYAATNRAFRNEFYRMLCWWKKRRIQGSGLAVEGVEVTQANKNREELETHM